jgi:hypothetical protein
VIVQLAGLILAVLLARRFRALPGLLRAAVFAQIADFATFSIVWNDFQEEHNPVADLILRTIIRVTGDLGEASNLLAALVLISLKCALIGYLIWAAPELGRYRRLVLVLALTAGAVGALSNFRLFGIFIGPGNVPML